MQTKFNFVLTISYISKINYVCKEISKVNQNIVLKTSDSWILNEHFSLTPFMIFIKLNFMTKKILNIIWNVLLYFIHEKLRLKRTYWQT